MNEKIIYKRSIKNEDVLLKEGISAEKVKEIVFRIEALAEDLFTEKEKKGDTDPVLVASNSGKKKTMQKAEIDLCLERAKDGISKTITATVSIIKVRGENGELTDEYQTTFEKK